MKWANSGIDWSRSKAFCIPNANEAYVRINKQGREPQGIVDGEQGYRNLIDMLDTEFQALTNPANGRSCIHRIYDTDNEFPGPLRDNLPDLVLTWDPEAKVLGELESPTAGRVCMQAGYETAPYYSGNHRPNAFVLARGPGVSRGSEIEGGHIVDLAPTILELLDVEPPEHFDGQSWQAMSSS
jgi:predicted AlkP superfamily phosphohydrolase/phosphomutase